MARPMPRFWSGVQQEHVGTCRLDTYGASHNDYLGITHDMSTDIDGIAKKAALGDGRSERHRESCLRQ